MREGGRLAQEAGLSLLSKGVLLANLKKKSPESHRATKENNKKTFFLRPSTQSGKTEMRFP